MKSRKNPDTAVPKRSCRYCHEEINIMASVCPHCNHYQTAVRNWIPTTSIISFLLLALTAWQAYNAYESNQAANEALRKLRYTVLISDAASRMRIGMKEGLNELRSFDSSAYDEDLRSLSRSLLSKITADYDSVHSKLKFKDFYMFKRTWYESSLIKPSLSELITLKPKVSDSLIISMLLKDIEDNHDLNLVARATIMLRYLTNIPFKMFDYDFIKRWKDNRSFSKE